MLKLALQARLPLICAHTSDPVNVGATLRWLAESKEPLRKLKSESVKVSKNTTWFRIESLPATRTPEEWARWFADADSSLVLVNPTEVPACAYDAGPIPTPRELVVAHLTEHLGEESAQNLLPVVGGLTITEVGWAVSLASAKHGKVTPAAVADVRRTAFPPRSGLAPVDCDLTGYMPDKRLSEWAHVHGPFFHNAPDPRLQPRGLLFDGPPGTGKTMGAKYLASALGVPLFRLAFEQVKDKWVGSSERALAQALAHAEAAAPCVLLLDEIEKLMRGHQSDSSGVTGDLLAALLWWMAEHRAQVLTVLTTNDATAIPPELIRRGRVDAELCWEPLNYVGARALADRLLDTFEGVTLTNKQIEGTLRDAGLDFKDPESRLPHAEVANHIFTAIKHRLLKAASPRRARVRVHRNRAPT